MFNHVRSSSWEECATVQPGESVQPWTFEARQAFVVSKQGLKFSNVVWTYLFYRTCSRFWLQLLQLQPKNWKLTRESNTQLLCPKPMQIQQRAILEICGPHEVDFERQFWTWLKTGTSQPLHLSYNSARVHPNGFWIGLSLFTAVKLVDVELDPQSVFTDRSRQGSTIDFYLSSSSMDPWG